MKTKPTIEQWKEAANILLLAERSLSDLFAHPVIQASKSTIRDQVRRSIQNLSKLKSNLDSDVCGAFPEADDSIVKVFYPGADNYHETTNTKDEAYFF